MRDWHVYIHSDPAVMLGKPVIKGTRITVSFVLDLYAAGWTEESILENYPHISKDSLLAVLSFTAECMKQENLYPPFREAA
ncbi:MAG TPA: DUF433 domain-containing protein [Desulfuromonadales bacterium]|nr:DUF433 domain-containing protein [Desulfuromonadales bacterium]